MKTIASSHRTPSKPRAASPCDTKQQPFPRIKSRSAQHPSRIIAVAGNIGSGKSSIVEWLRQHFDVIPFFEPNDENPYLADFYQNMSRWAFESQVFFLIRRFRLHRMMEKQVHDVVQDRTIYEDAEVFATHLYRSGVMNARDWASYTELYETLRDELRPPDLLLYLKCPIRVLIKRIEQRGRSFEQSVPRSYIKALDKLYSDWFEHYDLSPKITLDTHRIDYVQNLFDRHELVELIQTILKRI